MTTQTQTPPPAYLQYLRQIGALSNLGGQGTGNSALSTIGGDLSSVGNLVSGIQRGGVAGDVGAGLAANKLYDSATGTAMNPLLSGAGSALGLYNNLKQGGVGGDVGAAVDAGELYGTVGGMAGAPGAAAIGGMAGAAALPLGMMAAMYGLFQKDSTQNTHDAYQMDMNNAAGLRAAAAEPYNQPGEPWSTPGVNLQQIDNQEANSMEALANQVASHPGEFYSGTIGGTGTTPPVGGMGGGAGGNPSHTIQKVSEGGPMAKRKKSALNHIYEGPLFSQRKHFDDGGSAYGSYYNNYASYNAPAAPSYQTPAQLRDSGGTNSGIAAAAAGDSGLNSAVTPAELQDLQTLASSPGAATSSNVSTPGLVTGSDGTIDPSSLSDPNLSSMISGLSVPSGGQSQTSLDFQNALNNLNGTNGISGFLKALGSIAPLAGALIKPKTNTNTPTAVPGMTQGAVNPTPSTFNRTQNTSPSNTASKAPMSLQDWYTYGSRPEASFFNNNAVPLNQATGMATGQAKGGRQSALSELGGNYGMPEFDSAVEHHAQGPGDGTSDDIPAQLSDGEYVMDAPTVSLLGNGSNKAGAARLDTLRENLRKHAAKPMSKGKQFMKAKPPEKYMNEKGKEKKQ